MIQHDSDGGARCTLVPFDARRWHVGTERPTVVLPQIRTRYHKPSETDVRVRPIVTAEYLGLLYGAIEFTRAKAAQFCIFPEFSWPIDEVRNLLDYLNDCREEGRAYVIPLEHINVEQYVRLLLDLRSTRYVDAGVFDEELSELNDMNRAQDQQHAIVNVCLVILQIQTRLIAMPQRKLLPAALEEFSGLWEFVRGRTIRLVESGDGCRFAVLICFDFIDQRIDTPDRPRDAVARERINYLFIPECNPEPLHDFYFKGAIAMFQSPRWAQGHPIVLMVNVAQGSDLPSLQNPSFGFSRMIGKLGDMARTPDSHYLYGGFITHDSPRTLSELKDTRTRVPDRHVSTLVIRPEQSVALIDLPALTMGPKRDASVGRANTSVRIFRPIGVTPDDWRVVLSLPDSPSSTEELEIPEDYVVRRELEGVSDSAEKLEELIANQATPIHVTGAGGSGKTALVANVLHRLGEERVIWIDLHAIQRGEEPLLEAILRKLGRNDDVALPLAQKWTALRKELKTKPSVLVLDNVESSPGAVPARLIQLHSWKTLVIVISQSGNAEREPHIEVKPLSIISFRNLAQRIAPKENFSHEIVEHVFRATGGTALAAVWAGQLLKAAPAKKSSLMNALLPADSDNGLQLIYQWCYGQLKPLERQLLGVLCELPEPIAFEDLENVIDGDRDAITVAADSLRALGLLINRRSTSDQLHFRHPFVQRFWRNAPDSDISASRWRAVDWAKSVTATYRSTQRGQGYPDIAARWPNIANILRRLAQATGDEKAKQAYLVIWRNVDDFLWVTGRWRERLEFGEKAVEFAGDVEDLKLQAYALYNALGKTLWHRDASPDEAFDLIEKAREIAMGTGDDALRAITHWYKSRLHLHHEDFDKALAEAQIAEALASTTGDVDLIAVIQNALANVHRELGQYDDAVRCYDTADKLSSTSGTPAARELRVIIQRNLGRLELTRGHFAPALVRLEEAMEAFGRTRNVAQQAECVAFHAYTLAAIGEVEEARHELDWAANAAAVLGSAVVRRQIERIRAAIETRGAMQPA